MSGQDGLYVHVVTYLLYNRFEETEASDLEDDEKEMLEFLR